MNSSLEDEMNLICESCWRFHEDLCEVWGSWRADQIPGYDACYCPCNTKTGRQGQLPPEAVLDSIALAYAVRMQS